MSMMLQHAPSSPAWRSPLDVVLLPSMLCAPAPRPRLPRIHELLHPAVPLEAPPRSPDAPRWRHSKYCTVPQCERVSQRNGLCHRHGGKRTCKFASCNAKDRGNGYCIKHGGGRPCDVANCTKKAPPYHAPLHPRDMVLLPSMMFRAPLDDVVRPALPSIKSLLAADTPRPLSPLRPPSEPMAAAKPRWRPSKYCTVEDCERVSQRNGLCHRHGGKRSCKEPSCNAKDRGNGYCIKHGGGRPCDVANCGKKARRQGMCTQHFRLVQP
ncbi:hypothetical protein ACHHYP_05217 [Achlya hypogyna]|uniref:Uncharacterized protein n=1 Tax=Achlya hypogyna TaxID=1202772 RepID=A0A1V9YYP4_ACHHY|nr:hypothetical protein ACHHYP_05217 [Achlya hypogyna]